ncbi:hypothetical protein C8R44DRAFT_872015 [Mycena epipterygia]|nr:hypothetical protein C8R44DRAFT_872015 [Mycena epipterygia]
MSPPSPDIAAALTAAIAARVLTLTFDPLVEVVEDIWLELADATDLERASFIRAAINALHQSYFLFMNDRVQSLGVYELIKQHIFAHSTLKSILEKTPLELDPQEPTLVFTDTFLFIVGAVHRSLDATQFRVWFLSVFLPLIEASETVLRANDSQGPDADADVDADADSSRPSKKARTDTEGRFGHSYSLLCVVRDLQARTREKRNQEQVLQGAIDLAKKDSVGGMAANAKRDMGVGSSGWATCRQQVGRLVFRTSDHVRRAVSTIMLGPPNPPARLLPPSAAIFAPRLDPKPLVMPGAWPAPVNQALPPAVPSLRPVPHLVPGTQCVKNGDTYSRFASRCSSNPLVVHYCPLSSSKQ